MSKTSEFLKMYQPDAEQTSTTAQGRQFLNDPNYDVVDLRTFYTELADKHGRDFPNIRYVFDYLPIAHDGEKHYKLRDLAQGLLKTATPGLIKLEGEMINSIEHHFALNQTVDLVADIVLPYINKHTEILTGLAYIKGPFNIITLNHSLSQFQKMDDSLAQLRQLAVDRFPDETPAQHGIRIALSLMASEPVAATIAHSFATIFQHATGQKVSELNWGNSFASTGILKLFRCSTVDAKTISIDLTTCFKETDANTLFMFGAGPHVCPGRGVSMSLWRKISATMSKINARATHLETGRSHHMFFSFPSSIRLKVTHD